MIKKLLPIILALVGLGVGVAAGVALKPVPPEVLAEAGQDPCADPAMAGAEADMAEADAADAPAEGEEAQAASVEPCATPEVDPFAKVTAEAEAPGEEDAFAFVALDKPFVVPVFRGENVTAMVVMSLTVAVEKELEPRVKDLQPRLRDSFLAVMFRHANSGGFDGTYTTGQKMEDLKAALLKIAREVVAATAVSQVLITEIARQDV